MAEIFNKSPPELFHKSQPQTPLPPNAPRVAQKGTTQAHKTFVEPNPQTHWKRLPNQTEGDEDSLLGLALEVHRSKGEILAWKISYTQ